MRKADRRGQAVNQVFIFLLSALIFTMVVIYGYRAITSIGDTQEQAVLTQFKDVLESRTEAIALDYGSVKRVPLSIPPKYGTVCFVDTESIITMQDNTGRRKDLADEYPIIYDSVISGVKQNVFLMPLSDIPITLENIEIPNSYFCLTNKGGAIVLRLEGLGNRVKLEPWPDNA